MSTRALYTFGPDESGDMFNVYKHYDGYPEGAARAIENAKAMAWELPRFEADEFGAAFIAANKERAGNLRLMPGGKPQEVIPMNCGDIEFRYQVTVIRGKLHVEAYHVNAWEDYKEELFYEGSIEGLTETVGA